MTKVALLFYGLKPLSCLKKASPFLKKDITLDKWNQNVIIPNNCDVFIHSWSPEYQEECLEQYKPKKYLFEEKKHFPSRRQKIFDYGDTLDTINRSHLYSMKTVLELKNKYEQENNLTYDVVMIARMDIIWFNEINIRDIDVKEKIYISPWNYAFDKNQTRPNHLKAPYDSWFISNSKDINCFIDLYDKINEYINHSNSHWIKYFYFIDMGIQDKIDYMFYRFHDFVMLRWLFMPKNELYQNGQIGDEWRGWIEKREEHLKSLYIN